MPTPGVLLVAFGGPESLAQIEPFMCSVMGRQPTPEVLEATRRKYLTIGGASPLPDSAETLAGALERRLNDLPDAPLEHPEEVFGLGSLGTPSNRATEGVTIPVAAGMLHSYPSIDRVVDWLVAQGVDRVVWASLSPFESSHTYGAYKSAVEAACDRAGATAVEADPYQDESLYRSIVVSACRAALDDLKDYRPVVVFTAHSLPAEEIGEDRYVEQLEALAEHTAFQVGLGAPANDGVRAVLGVDAFGGTDGTAPWLLAYQSQGARPGKWLGPSLDEVIEAVSASDFSALAVCPIGFVMDHLETLYDLDVDAAGKVLDLDMEIARAKVPADDARFIEVLDEAIRSKL